MRAPVPRARLPYNDGYISFQGLLGGLIVGYNRSGKRRTQRLKRAKKHVNRLALKADATPAG